MENSLLRAQINALIKSTPNDMDLGKAVRMLMNSKYGASTEVVVGTIQVEECECSRDESGECKCQ